MSKQVTPQQTVGKLTVTQFASIDGTLCVKKSGGCGAGLTVDAPASFKQGINTDTIREFTDGHGVDVTDTLHVDNITELTLDHGVIIEGVTIKDGMISVPIPGAAACIQDVDLSTSVCANNDDTVTMTVNLVEKYKLNTNGGQEQGNVSTITASGTNSSASGEGTTNFAMLLGKPDIDGRSGAVNLVASGIGAHAEGGATVASGDYSHAEGIGTQAVGRASHAEGLGSKATGIAAHAEGDPCLASGDYSHAEGRNCTAAGFSSHAAGENATANANNSWCWSDGTVFGTNVPGSFNIRAGGQMMVDNGSSIPLATTSYNNQASWTYTPGFPANWPVVPNNVVQALDELATVAGTFSGGTTGLTPATPTTGNIVLGGTLNVIHGGTGTTSLSSGGILYGNSTSAVGASVGTTGQLLVSGGSGAPAWSGSIIYNGTTITGVSNPINPSDVVNKAYADSIATGFNVHQAVKTASTTNLNAIYNNGAAGVGATLVNNGPLAALTLDGISLNVGDRVLIKNQSNPIENGIYLVTNPGSGAVNWVLTRTSDYNNSSPGQVTPGDFVFDSLGTTQASTGWVQTNYGSGGVIVIGTDPIIFTQFSGSGTYQAGTGLNLIGNTFSNTGVLSVSGGSSGLTFSPSTGNAVLNGGILGATYGGTGFGSYTVGDLLIANTTSSLSRLSDAAVGNVLLSGGVGVVPSYGKVDLTSMVVGVLPLTNGGTGNTTGQPSGAAGGDLFGTYPNPGVKSFQQGISLNGTVVSDNIGIGVGTIGAITSGTKNIAIGTSSVANCTFGIENVGVGFNTLNLTSGNGNVALGSQAGSLATTANQTISIGYNAQSTASNAITIGANSSTTGVNSIAFGVNAITASNNTIAIGNAANAGSTSSIAIGQNAQTANIGSPVAVGAGSSATGNLAVAIGPNSIASGNTSTALGGNANAGGLGNTAIGTGATSTAAGFQTSIGASANTGNAFSVSLGYGANASTVLCTALGYQSLANGNPTLAVGSTANAIGTGAVAVGPAAIAASQRNTCLGTNSLATGVDCISMGWFAGTGTPSIATSMICIGNESLNNSYGIGATGSVAVGHQSLKYNGIGVNTTLGYRAGTNVANISYSAGTASQSGTTISTMTTTWTSTMQGGVIVFNSGISAPLTTFNSSTSFTSSVSQTVAVSGYTIYYGNLYNTGTVAQSGTTVTGTGTAFTSAMVGGWLIYATAQTFTAVQITAFTSGTSIIVKSSQTVTAGTSFYIYYSTSTQNTFIGFQSGLANIFGSQNTVVGYAANTGDSTSGSSVLGYNAIATGNSAVAIGINTNASGTRSLALGYQAIASGLSAIAIGQNAQTLHDGIAIGVSAFAANNVTVISIGYQSSATNDQAVALGTSSTASGYVSTAIGFGTLASARESLAMGRQALATGQSAYAIGHVAVSTGSDSIAIGTAANASVDDAIAIGHNSAAKALRCISIGGSAGPSVSTIDTIAIGYTALSNGILSNASTGCIGIGSQTLMSNTTGINTAIGYNAGSQLANNTYSTGSASQSGTTITGLSTTWTSAMQGGVIVIGAGAPVPLTTFNSPTSFTSTISQSVGSSGYAIYYGTLYNTGTVSQSGTTVTGTGTAFTSAMVGGWLVYATPQTYTAVRITSLQNSSTLTVNLSQTVAGGTSYYIYYTTSTQNTLVGYNTGNSVVLGSQNTIVGHNANANISTTGACVFGYTATGSGTNSVAVGSNSSATNTNSIAIGNGTTSAATNSTTVGQTFSNTVANTAVIAPNGAESLRVLDPAVGNFTFRTVITSISGTTPTPTEAQLIGGYIRLSDPGAVTLTIGTAGITGSSLSAYAQIAGNAYVGLTFKCIVVGSGTATNITVSGTANVASNGITPRGVLTSSALQSRELTFINTGANTWDMIVV